MGLNIPSFFLLFFSVQHNLKGMNELIPPLKIQGKKTKIVPNIMDIAERQISNHPEIDTWVEPFLGSGVVAFNCPDRIKNVIVNDINPYIISFYNLINTGLLNANDVMREMTYHSRRLSNEGGDYYNEIKERFNEHHSAMDFLFLTRTGFNGLMRFNGSGKWNVPFCKINDRLSESVIESIGDSVDSLSKLFRRKNFKFMNTQFDEVISSAPENSIFYCDPPYFGLNVQYYKGWGEADEVRLNEMLSDKTFIYSTWVNDGSKETR